MSSEEQIRRWIDGELGPQEQDALGAALQEDPELQALLRAELSLQSELRALREFEPIEPPSGIVDRITREALEAVARERQEPLGWLRWLLQPRFLRLRMTPAAWLVGLAALTLVAVTAYRMGLRRSLAPELATAGEAGEAPALGGGVEAPVAPEAAPLELAIPVRFVLPAAGAASVAVAGDFNGWDAITDLLMDEDGDGVFAGTLVLPRGTYSYMFVVDGERWVSDPYAENSRDDGFGHRNSILRLD
ncbi:MAG: hypothetical protein OEY14_04335 [Myxococcales bacterium]|nr:hypothetical protein [Myxococcales bacterium]